METITSKFRNLYIVKLFCGYLAAIFCICICLKFCDGTYPTKEKIAFFFIIVIICFTMAGSFDFLKLTKIILRKNDLEIQAFLGIRNRIIKYNEIVNIERHKIIQQGKAGQISDGFHLSEIILSDESSFILSPDKFENYNELIIFLRSNLNNQHSA